MVGETWQRLTRVQRLVLKRFVRLTVLVSVVGLSVLVPLHAQIGGGGISLPSWGHKKKQQQKTENRVAKQMLTADGHVMTCDDKNLRMFVDDGRTLTLKLTPETKYSRQSATIARSAVLPDAIVHIEAEVDSEAFLTATTIDVTKDPPVDAPSQPRTAGASQARPRRDEDEPRPSILGRPPDAPGRPILRHGIPKSPVSADGDVDDSADAPKSTSAPANKAKAPAPSGPKSTGDFSITGDETPHATPASAALPELVARTKDWSANFTRGLPNYVCKQETTRYVEESRSAGWQARDVVSATVIYQDGKELYRDIQVGGHRTNKNMDEIGGSTSSGEFASTLMSLFSDYSDAHFKMYQSTTMGNAAVTIYDFTVALKRSDWTIRVGGQALRPAYKGSVWIDKHSAEVRRIEMEAINVPKDFPFDSIQWAVDYDTVSLGTSSFLLPVHAENISCERGSSICSKNAIDFRDYHRYAGESTITFK